MHRRIVHVAGGRGAVRVTARGVTAPGIAANGFGDGPDRLGYGLLSASVNTSHSTKPTSGITKASTHQPERSVLCSRRTVTAVLGPMPG